MFHFLDDRDEAHTLLSSLRAFCLLYVNKTIIGTFRCSFDIRTLLQEGDDHRRQKRVMSPAFTEARVRELAGIFYEKTAQMVDQLSSEVQIEKEVDMTKWLSR